MFIYLSCSESGKQQFVLDIWPQLQKLTSNSECNKLANQPEKRCQSFCFPFIILPPYIHNQQFVVGVVKLCWRPTWQVARKWRNSAVRGSNRPQHLFCFLFYKKKSMSQICSQKNSCIRISMTSSIAAQIRIHLRVAPCNVYGQVEQAPHSDKPRGWKDEKMWKSLKLFSSLIARTPWKQSPFFIFKCVQKIKVLHKRVATNW